jgi:hypothetical protein
MKRNFLRTLTAAVAVATFFASCDDHQETLVKNAATTETTTSSLITTADETTKAAAGIFQFSATPVASSKEAVYRHEVGLLTEGFTTSYDESEGLIVNGDGSSIWLQIYSKSRGLEEGIYSFTGTQDNGKPFDFWYGAVDSGNKNYLFTEGQLIVTKDGDNYSLTVEGKITTAGSKDIKTIRSTYNGPIDIFEAKN